MLSDIIANAETHMKKTILAMTDNFSSVRTGRASALLLDRIRVDYYGQPTPITQMAGVKTPDAHMLIIEPWDKSALKSIERAILESDLGVTPSNDGMVIRLPFPQLTEERRKELVKVCRGYAEDSRVAIRNTRRDANTAIAKTIKEENLPEDEQKRSEDQIQKMTDKYIGEIDELLKKKEAEVMEI
ncbi:MAG: ribosome recycling factor [Eggerthellaceae bacterium]|nr:ribosome recycling factor [Eggerthellaceae bacterium]